MDKWVEGMLKYLNFFPNFCFIWWFFKVERSKCTAAKLWKIIKYDKNLAKKEEKPKNGLYKSPFFGWFRVPDPSLNKHLHYYLVLNVIGSYNDKQIYKKIIKTFSDLSITLIYEIFKLERSNNFNIVFLHLL